MRRLLSGRTGRWTAALALVVLLGLAGIVGKERTRWRTWYAIRGLTRAGDGDRDAWAQRVAELDQAALPDLLGCLRRDDPQVCTNALAALRALHARWEANEARSAELAGKLAEAFPRLSRVGQRGVLELAAQRLRSEPAPRPAVVASAVRLLAQAGRQSDEETRIRAFDLAAAVLERTTSVEAARACGPVVRAGLQDREPANRARAVPLALRPGIGLVPQVVPLLADPSAEVRRAVMREIGANRDAIDDDHLLEWLHDPDAEVRQRCENALRERGLREAYVKLGRLKTDRDPGVRLQVLTYLADAPDLDWGIWLRSLSRDPAPAVRAAAIRAAAAQTAVDLTDQIDQMAQSDPSPTVRQLAQHYLLCQKMARQE